MKLSAACRRPLPALLPALLLLMTIGPGCADSEVRFTARRPVPEPLSPREAAVGEYIRQERTEERFVSLRPDGTAKLGVNAGFGYASYFARWELEGDQIKLSHPNVTLELDDGPLSDSSTFKMGPIDLHDAEGRVYRKNQTAIQFDRYGQLPHLYASATNYEVRQSDAPTPKEAKPAGRVADVAAEDRLNLILISIDTLRADHVGCYGYDRETTPALDRFADQGVVFENFSANAPWTLPSHASMFTGLFVQRHGTATFTSRLPAVPTLASVLQQNGYFTKAVVNSWLVGDHFEFDRGFDTFVHIPDDQTHNPLPSGVVDRATRWLQNYHGPRFFLFLHLYDIHTDYRSLPQFQSMFVEEYDGPVDGSGQLLRAHLRGDLQLGDADARHAMNLYDAEIRQVDEQLSWLFKVLDDVGLTNSTVVMVTSDHGELFMEHGAFLHGQSQWQEVLQVPLIVGGADIPAGRRVSEVASSVDIMPTALSLLKIPCPKDIDGIDLSPTWQSPAPQWPSRFIFAGGDSGHSGELAGQTDVLKVVRDNRFKLQHNLFTGETTLYDLENDPGETTNVADQQPAVRKLLRETLDRHLQNSAAAGSKPTRSLSEQDMQRLKALGYLD